MITLCSISLPKFSYWDKCKINDSNAETLRFETKTFPFHLIIKTMRWDFSITNNIILVRGWTILVKKQSFLHDKAKLRKDYEEKNIMTQHNERDSELEGVRKTDHIKYLRLSPLSHWFFVCDLLSEREMRGRRGWCASWNDHEYVFSRKRRQSKEPIEKN